MNGQKAVIVASLVSALLVQASGRGYSQGSPVFICPGESGVCSWESGKGWQVLWRAREGVARDRLTLIAGSSGDHTLWQASPYGATVFVLGEEGEVEAVIEQGAPLKPASAIGEALDGGRVVCTGGSQDRINCSVWLAGPKGLATDKILSFPQNCLYPRFVSDRLICVTDLNPFRDPALPLRVSLWIGDPARGEEDVRLLELPPGFISDFLPLSATRALISYEDGRVFDAREWKEVLGPIATGATKLESRRGKIYIMARPQPEVSGKILRLDGTELVTVWEGSELPRELEVGSEGLLVRLEGRDGRSRLLAIREEVGGKVTWSTVWDERRFPR